MKRIIAIAFVVVLALTCTLSIFAAGALNADEKRIMSALQQTVTVGNQTFGATSAQINQAKNYFLRSDVDITKEQADKAIDFINKIIAAFKAAKPSSEDATFSMADLPRETKAAILEYGQEAAAAVGLVLTYDAADHTVLIVDNAGTTVFENDPVVKATGSDVSVGAIAVVVVLLTVLSAGAVVITKKAKLF